jgi:hypothetical protein
MHASWSCSHATLDAGLPKLVFKGSLSYVAAACTPEIPHTKSLLWQLGVAYSAGQVAFMLISTTHDWD